MLKVKDKMTTNVATVPPNATVAEAAKLMQKHNVGSVPVTDGGNLVGIVTDRDIVVRNIAHDFDPKSTPVSNIMTTNLVTVTPDATIDEVTQKMSAHQVRRIPVVENQKLVGMVSIGDVATDRRFDVEASKALSEISRPSRPEML